MFSYIFIEYLLFTGGLVEHIFCGNQHYAITAVNRACIELGKKI